MLAAAGHEVVKVPAWRVKRKRPHEGPGTSDPADAVAIAQCALRHSEKLGPALEPRWSGRSPSWTPTAGSR
jgi:hypothetical protein